MSVSPVSAVTSVQYSRVYALSPYLNGIVRVSDAVRDAADAAASLAATATPRQTAAAPTSPQALALQSEITARSTATSAISSIATSTAVAVAPQLPEPTTPTPLVPLSPTAAVLTGDAGLLVQSYGAVALIYGPQAHTAIAATAPRPAVQPPAPVAPLERIRPIDAFA